MSIQVLHVDDEPDFARTAGAFVERADDPDVEGVLVYTRPEGGADECGNADPGS